MEAIETIEYKGYTIEVHQDEDPTNPRDEFDNTGVMLCFHQRYALGDKHSMSFDEAKAYLGRPDVLALPLMLYDHGSLSISTRSFYGRVNHAEWDSGQVGWITITKAQAVKEWGYKKFSKGVRDRALKCLESEVEIYDQYLRGEVYGFNIKSPESENVNSCWGFYGDPEEYMVPECRGIIDHRVVEKEAFESNIAPVLM